MGNQMVLLQVRQAAPVLKLKQGLWEQTAVHPVAQSMTPAAEKLTRLNTDQNFSSVPLHRNGNSQTETACPLSPRTCPFGGACHTCPVHVQPKLKISQPDDEYEREADRVADAVMRMPEPKEGAEEWCHLPSYTQIAQRQATNVATSSEAPPIVYEALRSSGQPLDDSTRTFMELRFRQDFGDVRVHTDALSAKSAQQINSLAYTTGQDITFAVGQFQPGMDHGRKLIAHELSHVIQQRASNCPRDTVIQRWGPGAHKALTTDYTRKYLTFFERMEIDEDALKRFADSSADMDLRLPELWFNFKGKIVGVGKKMKLSKPEQALEQLKKLYNANPSRARNHGEGGLYASPISVSAKTNLAQQEAYEMEARIAFGRLNRQFHSIQECESVKGSAREIVFDRLGNAMHVAQDRGAHGEGATDLGHAKEILEGVNPDSPEENSDGYIAAQRNTELLSLRTGDMLRKLLDKHFSRSCSFVRETEVHTTGPT